MVRRFARSLAWHLAPQAMADRAIRLNREVRERAGVTASAREYSREHGLIVAAGPFQGLTYPTGCEPDVDALVDKLAGRYEAPLQEFLAEEIARRPARCIDIGAADGYYAVGLARHGIPVIGFELSPRQRRLCKEVASVNDVSIDLRGEAKAGWFGRLTIGDALIISDCEGAEARIFDAAAVTAAQAASVLIELHEWATPGVERLLASRFADSHETSIVLGEERTLRRDGGRWLVARPMNRGTAGSPSS